MLPLCPGLIQGLLCLVPRIKWIMAWWFSFHSQFTILGTGCLSGWHGAGKERKKKLAPWPLWGICCRIRTLSDISWFGLVLTLSRRKRPLPNRSHAGNLHRTTSFASLSLSISSIFELKPLVGRMSFLALFRDDKLDQLPQDINTYTVDVIWRIVLAASKVRPLPTLPNWFKYGITILGFLLMSGPV